MAMYSIQMSVDRLVKCSEIYATRSGYLPGAIFFEVIVPASRDWVLKRLADFPRLSLGHKTEEISVVQRAGKRWLAR
jgi:uncharacterized radical SAM superfamily Fe-S cluster-containing enzyme